jgi:hypothetical protein
VHVQADPRPKSSHGHAWYAWRGKGLPAYKSIDHNAFAISFALGPSSRIHQALFSASKRRAPALALLHRRGV